MAGWVIDLQAGSRVGLTGEQVQVVRKAAVTAMLITGHRPEDHELAIVISGDDEVARLNEQFRGVEGPTDVLAFAAESDFPHYVQEPHLGDVIVSIDRAREQALDAGHSLERELAVLVAHGVLHLLGLDHAEPEEENAMWSLQERVAEEAVGARE